MKMMLLVFLTAFNAIAALQLPVAWDAPTSSVIQWKIYVGTNSGIYQKTVLVTNGSATSFTLVSSNLFPGATNYMAMTALTPIESDFSNEIAVSIPSAPKNFRVTLSMDSAPSPTGPWTETITITNSVAVQDTAYFRGRLDIQPSSGVP